MKKVILTIITALASTIVCAEDLQCEKNYDMFKKVYQSQIKNIEDGNVEALKKSVQQTDYDRLFTDQHPNQIYFVGNWIPAEKYNEALQMSFNAFKAQGYKNKSFEFSKPKVNFISEIGEICVVPTISEDLVLGEKQTSKSDTIFVRNLKNNEWRIFTYIGIEEKKDMHEFFGKYTSALKLDKSTVNGKNFPDYTRDVSIGLYKYLGIEATPEAIEAIDKQMQPYRDRLKANGY